MLDEENDRIVVISLWELREQAAAATGELHPLVMDVPREEWELRPGENLLGLVRAVWHPPFILAPEWYQLLRRGAERQGRRMHERRLGAFRDRGK